MNGNSDGGASATGKASSDRPGMISIRALSMEDNRNARHALQTPDADVIEQAKAYQLDPHAFVEEKEEQVEISDLSAEIRKYESESDN